MWEKLNLKVFLVYAEKTKPKVFFPIHMVIKKYKSFDLCFFIPIVYAGIIKPKVFFFPIHMVIKKYESFDLCFFISIIYAEKTIFKVYFWNII